MPTPLPMLTLDTLCPAYVGHALLPSPALTAALTDRGLRPLGPVTLLSLAIPAKTVAIELKAGTLCRGSLVQQDTSVPCLQPAQAAKISVYTGKAKGKLRIKQVVYLTEDLLHCLPAGNAGEPTKEDKAFYADLHFIHELGLTISGK